MSHTTKERHNIPDTDLMTPKEVARRFGVNSKTVTRWAKAGKFKAVWTLGGHRRYRRAEVDAFISAQLPTSH